MELQISNFNFTLSYILISFRDTLEQKVSRRFFTEIYVPRNFLEIAGEVA